MNGMNCSWLIRKILIVRYSAFQGCMPSHPLSQVHVTQPPPISNKYHVRDQVWLKGTHLKLPHQMTKLAPKCYGPFKITKQINPSWPFLMHGRYTQCFVCHSYPLIMKPKPMDPTILDHHLTLSVERNSLRWSKSRTTNIMDSQEHSNTSSNGKEALKVTTHGNQLTWYSPLTY